MSWENPSGEASAKSWAAMWGLPWEEEFSAHFLNRNKNRGRKMANKGKRLTEYLADYVVFDLETTGISKQTDEIIEISAIKVKDHRIIEEFSTLVNPGRPIPAGATAVNGITDEMVLDAPGRMEAISDFLSFVGDQVLEDNPPERAIRGKKD